MDPRVREDDDSLFQLFILDAAKIPTIRPKNHTNNPPYYSSMKKYPYRL